MNLSNVNLNLLVILDALLQERSVSHAAVRLGRSQPAISHALQRLRHLFDDELLVQAGRQYKLTAVANALVEPLHASLRQMNQLLVNRPTFDPGTSEREFTLCMSDFTATVLLRPLLRKLADQAPRIRMNIVQPTQDLVGALRNGDHDIAIYPRNVFTLVSDLISEVVLNDTWCCVAWSGNPELSGGLTRELFDSLPHVIDHFTPAPEQGDVSQLLAVKGSYRKHILRTNHIILMPFLLEGTSALAVMPGRLARLLCQTASLCIHPLPFELPELTYEMSWSAPRSADPAHSWLRRLLKDIGQTEEPAGVAAEEF